jgi:hypothetical protein
MSASPGQSTAIPLRAIGIAVDLENKRPSETDQKISEADFQPAFRYFVFTYKCA